MKTHLKNLLKIFLWFLYFLLFLELITPIAKVILDKYLINSNMDKMLMYSLISLVLYLIGFGVPYLLIRILKKYKPNMSLFEKDNKFKNKNIWNNVIWAVIAAFTLQILGMCISGLSTMVVGSNTLNDAFEGFTTNYPAWLLSLIIAIPPAVFEELIYRGVIYDKSKNYFSPFISAIISSILFGAMHMDLQQLPYAIVLGFAFAIIYEKTKSLYTTMLIHFIIDFSQFYLVVVELKTYGDELANADTELPKELAIVFSLVAILFALANAKVIKNFKLQNEDKKEITE